jgi:hypothetical protein
MSAKSCTNALDVSAPLHVDLEFTVTGMTAYLNAEAVVRLPWIGKAWAW